MQRPQRAARGRTTLRPYGPAYSRLAGGVAGSWRWKAEQGLAVAAAEQEGEPFQVLTQLGDAVGGVADEFFQRCGQPGGVAGEPPAEELQHLGEFGASVTSSLTSGMGSPPSGVGGVGLEAADFAAGGAGHGGDGLAVDDQPETVVLGDEGDDLSCVGHADLDLLAGDLDAAAGGDPPLHRDSGFRQVGGPGQAGALQAVALAGWDGARQMRHSTPSWVRTCISWPSRRRRARCPASGEPTRISRFSRLIPPMPLTSRSTSTHLLAASTPGDGPAGGGPAGRASVRRSRARSTSDNREGTVLIRHPPMLRWQVVASIHNVTFCPARAGLSQNCCPPTHKFPDGGATRSTSI